MLEGGQELAENKLLLLYIFNKINLPVSNIKITEIVLENNLINYFSLQRYLGDLVNSGFLNLVKENKKHLYSISYKGKNVLDYFGSRINNSKKKVIDSYLDNLDEMPESQYDVSADYYPSDEDYIVICKIAKDGKPLIELKINISSLDRAKYICEKWKKGGHDIYKSMMDLFSI
jgi:predicted transcriptional regulator